MYTTPMDTRRIPDGEVDAVVVQPRVVDRALQCNRRVYDPGCAERRWSDIYEPIKTAMGP